MIIDHVKVIKANFDDFLKKYPRPLVKTVDQSYAAHIVSFEDKSLDRNGHCRVAYHSYTDATNFQEDHYWIARNYIPSGSRYTILI